MSIEILTPIVTKKKVTYPVIILDKKYEFFVSYDQIDEPLNGNIDGIVCMLSSIAICNKLTIKSKLPIDKKLYDNLKQIPQTYKNYHHKHTGLLAHIGKDELKLDLHMPVYKRQINKKNVVTPISMGIDSIYAIMKKTNVTHVFYVKHLDNSTTVKNFNKNVEYAAKRLGKKLIIVESNFKSVIESLQLHGTNYAIFTADSMILASLYPYNFKKIIFNGMGIEGDNYFPCLYGQHTHINRYLTSNEFEQENIDALRVKKIKYIFSAQPKLFKLLKVCNEHMSQYLLTKNTDNYGDYYTGVLNCTKCGKCKRTLAYIYMLGYYNDASSFVINNNEHNNSDYLDKFIQYNEEHRDSMILASKYFDMIFQNVLNILRSDGNLNNIEKYEIHFENDVSVIKNKN